MKRICKRCEKPFEVATRVDGTPSKAQMCPSCRSAARRAGSVKSGKAAKKRQPHAVALRGMRIT